MKVGPSSSVPFKLMPFLGSGVPHHHQREDKR